MNWKYSLGVLMCIPLLPILFLQGKRVKATVPDLPEPTDIRGQSLPLKTDWREGHNKPFQLLVLGESTMAGVGVKSHETGFAGSLGKALSEQLNQAVNWEIYAESGIAVEQLTKQIVPTITETHADLIVIGMGANDAFQLSTPNAWKNNILGLVKALREKFPKTPLVFLNMPPIKEFPAFPYLMRWAIGNLVEIFGEELAKTVEAYPNVYYSGEKITLAAWAKRWNIAYTDSTTFFSDGIHPSKTTYQVWAKEVARFVRQNIG